MKKGYSYQEIGTRIDQGKRVACTCYPQARVSAVQKHPENDTITVTINFSIRDTCIGIVSDEYASMRALLDAFDIEELSEMWEVLE